MQQPAPAAQGPYKNHTLVTALVLAVLIIGGGYLTWYTGLFNSAEGSVSVLVRSVDGAGSAVSDLNLASGALTARGDVDPASVSSESMKIFALADGSYITLSPSGVIKKDDTAKTEQLLVATAIAPLPRTPLAVWGDGARLAWVSPADGSVQVFERTEHGSYAPLYLTQDLLVNSLGFSTDGSTLVLAKIGAESTDFYTVDLASGTIKKLLALTGLASIIPTI